MKKGYFLIGYKNISRGKTGIGKKIQTQIDAMRAENVNCQPYVQQSGREFLPTILGKLLYILPFSNVSPKWQKDKKFEKTDFIYFRRPIFISYALRRFLKQCKKLNHNLKVYVEIPTFPYDPEYKRNIFDRYLLIKDRYNRKKLRGLVDCFFVIDPMNQADNLYGIKTKKFINGYDVKNTLVRAYTAHKPIILACVAMFSFWHGYERLFYGLSNYYKKGGKRDIEIEVIGEGAELASYKRIVEDLSLSNHVHFRGKLFDKDLDDIYQKVDIGIGCLGCYKKEINIISDLKTREYLAKGIPVLSGCTVDIFSHETEFEFYKEIPNNSEMVNLHQVVEYYDYIMKRKKEINTEQVIHDFALENFDISNTIKDITDIIKEDIR